VRRDGGPQTVGAKPFGDEPDAPSDLRQRDREAAGDRRTWKVPKLDENVLCKGQLRGFLECYTHGGSLWKGSLE
jgi:hypothetical protein